MNLASLHVTHKQVGVEQLEPLASLDGDQVVRDLVAHEDVTEAAVLATCNRFEVYVAGPDPVQARGAALRLLEDELPERGLERGIGLDSIEHLMRVAAGLESLIVGEDQILAQVKTAYERSLELDAAGPDVGLAFKKAIQVGKRARTETAINRGAVSVGSAAVSLAERRLGGLAGKRLLVLGAGDMGQLVAKSLVGKDLARVAVTSRDVDKARRLARELDGDAFPYHGFTDVLPEVDVVICATSAPHHVLTRSVLRDAHGGEDPGRDMLIIDISNPRQVHGDVEELPGVTLRNLDGLQRIAEENRARRVAEVEKAESIVYQQLLLVSREVEERRAEDAIRALHERMRTIRDREYEKALRKLNGVTPDDKEVMRNLVTSALSKLLATPTLNLKQAAKAGETEQIEALVELFSLDAGTAGNGNGREGDA